MEIKKVALGKAIIDNGASDSTYRLASKERFANRPADVEEGLRRVLVVAGEMLRRVEEQVLLNAQNKEEKAYTYDIRSVNTLMSQYAKCADLYLKIQKDAERKGKKLTPEEKDNQIIRFIATKGPVLRGKFLRKLQEKINEDE